MRDGEEKSLRNILKSWCVGSIMPSLQTVLPASIELVSTSGLVQ